MKLTIITVVYNARLVIARAIDSVLNQIERPYEYIIVDGNSTDGTLDIARSYCDKFKDIGVRYRIYSEKDNGIYDAMNKGIAYASGTYIAFLNSDDWYECDAVKIIYDEYERNPFDLAYGTIAYKKGKKSIIKNSRLDYFVSSRNWNHPSTVAKKTLFYNNTFDLYFKIYSDFDWYLKQRKRNIKISIFSKNKVIVNFSMEGASTGDSFESMLLRAKEKYLAYRHNGYSKMYFLETYCWEFIKYVFVNLLKKY